MITRKKSFDPFSYISQSWNDVAHASMDSDARTAVEGVSSLAGKPRPTGLFRRLMSSLRLG